jgi:hypothetical protein
MKIDNTPTTPAPESTPKPLSPIAEMLIQAVDSELKGDIIPRHKLNILSPSFPYNHRTMANRDNLKTDVREFIVLRGRRFYVKRSLLKMLREDLSKAK